MRRRSEMSGIFDWFRKLVPPSLPPKEPSMLPVLRPQQLPALPPKEKKSVIEFFRSKPTELIQAPQEVVQALAPLQKTLLPQTEEEAIKWTELIPREPETGVPTSEDLMKYLKPSTIQEASRYRHPTEWPLGEPPIWSFTPWEMPTTYEIAEHIRDNWDLNGIYEFVLREVDKPYWKRQVAESAHVGEPAAMDVEQLTDISEPWSDLAKYLRIPDVVIERYARYGPEGAYRFDAEVMQPMIERVEKALEVFRPTPVLRGWFEIEPDSQMNFWLRYKESRFPQGG